MDYPLIERHLSGEADATQELRGEIRTLAMRILAHDAYGVPTAADRRKLATEIETEVLELGGTLPAHFVNSALLVTNRRGIERRRTEREEDEGHLPAQVLVTYALRPTELAGPARKAVSHHLGECAFCRGDIERTKIATRETMSPAPAPEPSADPLIADSEVGADIGIEEAAEAALRGLTTAPSAPSTPRPRQQRRGVRSARRGPQTEKRKPRRWPWVIGLVAMGAWFWTQREAPHTGGKMIRNPALAQLASLNIPSSLTFEGLPLDAEGPYDDLMSGDCDTAAARFRTSRKRHPQVGRVWLFEGIAALCGGDHRTAATVLDEARLLMPTSEPAWWRAQTALIAGDEDVAIEALEWVAEYDVTKRREANALIRAVESQRR